MTKLDYAEVARISKEYDLIIERLEVVCKCIKKEAWRRELPRISQSSLWPFRHGTVDCCAWSVLPACKSEEAKIWISAWDGYDAESFNNTSVLIPFEFINMTEDELTQLLRGETNEH